MSAPTNNSAVYVLDSFAMRTLAGEGASPSAWKAAESLAAAKKVRTAQQALDDLKVLSKKAHKSFSKLKIKHTLSEEETRLAMTYAEQMQEANVQTGSNNNSESVTLAIAKANGFVVVSDQLDLKGKMPWLCKEKRVQCISSAKLLTLAT